MAWTIEYAAAAQRQLRKLNPHKAKQIVEYMDRRISTTDDPKVHGHALVGNLAGYWRYRVDDMRVICEIKDERLSILVVKVGHRGTVYGD